MIPKESDLAESAKAQPIKLLPALLVSIAVVVLGSWGLHKLLIPEGTESIDGSTYYFHWSIWIIPLFLVLICGTLSFDGFLNEGRVLHYLGRNLPPRFRAFGDSLMSLREWYLTPEEKIELYPELEEHLSNKRPFARWMITEINLNYENNVQGWAYIGAALLIGLIGLRGMKIIPKEHPSYLLFGLELEFSLLLLLGSVLFFKPEESRQGHSQDGDILKIRKDLRQLATRTEANARKNKELARRMEQEAIRNEKLAAEMKGLAGRISGPGETKRDGEVVAE
jgi:hypothetical protein